jgi:BirA family transcriptional regulator, biotin operon repressor / biotin---[acetyl-CoA-carboxylase] ligase
VAHAALTPASKPPPTRWAAEALWERLLPLLPGLSVEVRAQCGSTNTELLGCIRRSGADMLPCLLVAEHQTQGRGRLGRVWQSEPGSSLTFSLALPLAPADWSGLSLAVGLALAQALDPVAEHATPAAKPRVLLKWPNDLWLRDDADQARNKEAGPSVSKAGAMATSPAAPLAQSPVMLSVMSPAVSPVVSPVPLVAPPPQGRKLGGVLIETVNVGSQRWCVVGVGLNLRPVQRTAADFSTGFACLQELDPAISAPAALARVAEPLLRELLRFEREGFAPLVARYAERDVLRGHAVVTAGQGGAAQQAGLAQDVDSTGALRLRSATGLVRIVSGEVGVRWAPTLAAAEGA